VFVEIDFHHSKFGKAMPNDQNENHLNVLDKSMCLIFFTSHIEHRGLAVIIDSEFDDEERPLSVGEDESRTENKTNNCFFI
jgi:hypothetical protein